MKYRYIITKDHRTGQDTLFSDAVGLQGPAYTTLTAKEAHDLPTHSFTVYSKRGAQYEGKVVGIVKPRALLSNFKGCTSISTNDGKRVHKATPNKRPKTVYEIRLSSREGDLWTFSLKQVDQALATYRDLKIKDLSPKWTVYKRRKLKGYEREESVYYGEYLDDLPKYVKRALTKTHPDLISYLQLDYRLLNPVD